MHLCETRANERSARREAAKQDRKNVEQRDAEKNKEEGTHPRSAMIAETLAAAVGQGRGLPDPPKPSPPISPDQRRSACRLYSRDLRSIHLPFSSAHEQQQLLEPRSVAGSLALEARVEQCLEGMGRLLSDSFACAESRAGLRRARHECPAHGAGLFAADHNHLPQALTLNAIRASCIKEAMEAATQAREQQEEAGLAHDQKCQDAAEAETMLNDATKNTLEKTEALEKHVKTGDDAGGILGDHGGRFLQNTSRPSKGNAEALGRTLCPAVPDSSHAARIAPRKKTSTCTRLSAHEV